MTFMVVVLLCSIFPLQVRNGRLNVYNILANAAITMVIVARMCTLVMVGSIGLPTHISAGPAGWIAFGIHI